MSITYKVQLLCFLQEVEAPEITEKLNKLERLTGARLYYFHDTRDTAEVINSLV